MNWADLACSTVCMSQIVVVDHPAEYGPETGIHRRSKGNSERAEYSERQAELAAST